MTEFRWAEEADYQALIEQANHAFDTAHYTGDFEKDTSKESFFPRVHPKLYQNPRIAPMHVLAIEDGRICGLVGAFELPYVVHGTPLHVVGIGTVSVRPGYRRKGYMKELMARAIRRAKDEDADYMILGGQRQRYGHWGFEQGGVMPLYEVYDVNFSHTYGENADFGYSFRKLTPEDTEVLARERALREAAEVHMIHPEDEEFRVLCTGETVPYVIEKDGLFAGTFMYYEQDPQVGDLRLTDKQEVGHVLNDILRFFGLKKMKALYFGPEEKEMMRILSALAEDCSIIPSGMIKILNYERVIRAYFELKASLWELPDGELRLSFENGEKLLLTVRDEKPEVRKLKEEEGPFLALTEKEAVQLIFNPHTWLHFFGKEIPMAARAWFPLPLYENLSDTV
ncbi:MAG: GNAT family N-acetyltransferase [Lachnospiraceae bacterium]|nr:GNAT family N-acetyltransferase [Lachnospiraceae bacterium]